MMRERRKYECAYCGEIRPATRDHVPPKVIYVKPLPAQCPSANACEECKTTASSGDEFRAHRLQGTGRRRTVDRVAPDSEDDSGAPNAREEEVF